MSKNFLCKKQLILMIHLVPTLWQIMIVPEIAKSVTYTYQFKYALASYEIKSITTTKSNLKFCIATETKNFKNDSVFIS